MALIALAHADVSEETASRRGGREGKGIHSALDLGFIRRPEKWSVIRNIFQRIAIEKKSEARRVRSEIPFHPKEVIHAG